MTWPSPAEPRRTAQLEAQRAPARRGWLSRHGWVVVLVVGAGLFWAVLESLVRTGNPNLVPSLILLGALLVPVTFVTWVYQHARSAAAHPDLIAIAALFGGVIGVVVAGRVEYATVLQLGVMPTLGIGLIEESAKLIVPVAIVLLSRGRWREVDGLVLGVAVGMGFAVLETMGYAFVALLRSGLDLDVVVQLLLLRGVLSPAAHAAWTGLATAALWSAARGGWNGRGVLHLAGTFVLVVVLHGLWDGLSTWWAYVLLAAVALLLLHREMHRTTLPAHRERIAA
ncbi:PrsW family intramembrane metalloprotease [Kineococcus gypseus]|uniref:PrsW family intramembrane metalloprotease n=1 Tax=Kineococcus gypseus TaxID=1637102 RepID=UPI003D7E46E1